MTPITTEMICNEINFAAKFGRAGEVAAKYPHRIKCTLNQEQNTITAVIDGVLTISFLLQETIQND